MNVGIAWTVKGANKRNIFLIPGVSGDELK